MAKKNTKVTINVTLETHAKIKMLTTATAQDGRRNVSHGETVSEAIDAIFEAKRHLLEKVFANPYLTAEGKGN